MKVEVISVSALGENVYIFYDEQTLKGIIIDPGAEAQKIINFIEKSKINLEAILLTHGHVDHIGAVSKIKEVYNIPVVCHELEAEMLKDATKNLSTSLLGKKIELNADILLKDEGFFEFDNKRIKAIHTPGHTMGGCCYYYQDDDIVFTGDTLFFESVGRTDFYLGDSALLQDSIIKKLFILPPKTVCYPGHGSYTSIEHERIYNPYLKFVEQ